MNPRSTTHLFKLFCLLILVSLACNLPLPASTSPTAQPTQKANLPPTAHPKTQAPPSEAAPTAKPPDAINPTAPPDIHGRAFASYPSVSVELPAVFNGGYSLPVDIANVQGVDGVNLSQSQQALLAQNGFVVTAPTPGKYREFYQVYESQRYETDQPIFVTTDAVFHIYHLIFDKMLRDLETEKFITDLEAMTSSLLAASVQQYQALKGSSIEQEALRNVAYFAVADQLLGQSDPYPAEADELVKAELANIEAHGGMAISPIWDRPDLPEDMKLVEDYSQYIPRGHYTRSEALQRYFKAMMWYGRLTFRLKDAFETRRALLLTEALRTAQAADGTPVATLWQNIYDPTVFIVGKSDDLSYYEYGTLSDLNFGSHPDLKSFGDQQMLEKFTAAARTLPAPQINSMWVWIWQDTNDVTQGFRMMGQRFTLDEYVFGQLIWRKVGTQDKPRGLPKGLDFLAAMGSEEALGLLKDAGETQYQNYPEQMSKVRSEIASLQLDSWTQNLYWSWLYAFQPIIQVKDARYPAFMQTRAWTLKDLNTALGSWTELKHDTILYAKQVMAEMGGGGPETPPHGYVEPNPEAYARLLALAQMTYSGLQERNLLSDRTMGNLRNLMDLLTFLKTTSESELAGRQISDEDYWRIQYIGGNLEALTLAASDCEDPNNCRDLHDQKSALIADVATGLTPQGGLAALEEAVGEPTEIYVVLPDQPYRVGVGAVFTYYEFPVSVDQRMTDEQWQEMLANGTNPALPDWTGNYLSK